ncbi:helix-turn-helix domain-containing protein [[Mycobacterium] wendilense]|uniref:Helix-turn-helix domain-containing protein n=1 Tax=[Mycobacterium] wendilense TaxID=3064284 RepID=A0ABM9MKP2_9MYCO|nr:helix-turn-helix domain-containing protein [Mycolicibacterium sp. MU0050]CAJ1587494.1 helix-turn-helix domain-containing protein [Mycolicibacterium sp. MU0050]
MVVGRPREFDPDAVEDAAMKLFWERGYDAVSIADVSAATGVNRRGIYAEFGSKESLFDRATRRYLAGPGGYLGQALARRTAREVAAAMMHGAADTVSGEVRGCLTVGDGPGLAELRAETVRALAGRFDVAMAAGEIAPADTALLARWVAAVCQGIAVQARCGAGRDDLHAVADLALAGWDNAVAGEGPGPRTHR